MRKFEDLLKRYDRCANRGIRGLYQQAYTDTHANLINYYQYTANIRANIVFKLMDYTLPVANPPIYDMVNDIPGLISDTTIIANLSSYTKELSSTTQRYRNIFLTLTFANNATMYRKAVDISNSYLKSVINTLNLTWSLLFKPIPAIISNADRANGGNILEVDRNTGNLIRKFTSLLSACPSTTSKASVLRLGLPPPSQVNNQNLANISLSSLPPLHHLG